MSKLHVQHSALSNNIYVGTGLKNGCWGKNKTDVTTECVVATAEHALQFGGDIKITDVEGNLAYTISVKKGEQRNG